MYAEQQQSTSRNGSSKSFVSSLEEPGFIVDKEIEVIHRKLLSTVSDIVLLDSWRFEKFLQISKAFNVSNDVLKECRRKQNLFKLFEALDAVGRLRAGMYKTLIRIAKESNNEGILVHIDNAKRDIKKLKAGKNIGSKHDESVVRQTKMYQNELTMSIRCSTIEGVEHIVDYFTNGKIANNLNNLSEAVSDLVGEKIEVTISLGLTEVHEALKNTDAGLHSTVREEDKVIKNADFSVREKDEVIKMLQMDLITFYRDKCHKYQMASFIEDGTNFLAASVKPVLISSSKMSKEESELTRITSLSEIFVKKGKPCRNIYISSEAGCGKTSFSRWLALTWCQAHQPVISNNKWFSEEDINVMKTFQILWLVSLQDEQECDCDIMIQNQLLRNLANCDIYTQLGLEYLQELLCHVKYIIILDGLDEWSHSRGNRCAVNDRRLPHCLARETCTTLTTSRPWKLDVVGLKSEEIDQKLQIKWS